MKRLKKYLTKITSELIEKGKQAEQEKAGKKWDDIVQELRQRK